LSDPQKGGPLPGKDYTSKSDPSLETETDTPREAPVELSLIEWRSDGSNDGFTTLTRGDSMGINRIQLRLTFSEKPVSVAVRINGVEVEVIKVLNFAFVHAEIINGDHEMEITVTHACGTAVETVPFTVDGSASYPAVHLEAPQDLLRGETADLTVRGQNPENLDSLTLTLNVHSSFLVEDVILADGISGMYMRYRGTLVIVAKVADASAVTDGLLATVRVRTPVNVDADGLDWSIRSCEAVMNRSDGMGDGDNFVGSVDLTIPEVGVSYPYSIETSDVAYVGADHALRVRHYDGTYAADMGIYTLMDGEHVLIGRTDGDGRLVTSYFDVGGSYGVYVMVGDDILSETVRIDCLPHEGEHDFRLSFEIGCLICDYCDARADVTTYVGPVRDGEDLKFLSGGVFKAGWQVHMGKTYYLLPDKLTAVDGEVEIGGYTYLFEDYTLKLGAWFERDGVRMLKWAGVTQRQTWITMDGKTYYFNSDGGYLTGVTQAPVVYDGVTVMEYHRFDQSGVHQGRLADGLYVDDELIVYTVNGIARHMGLVRDDEGNFYYISSSCEGIRNTTRYVDSAWTNGLLPAGTYTFGMDGRMIDPPEIREG
ncbi:MAG: hypothetical protein IJD38_07130, partial [Clostridia bacterium]|nr:hypothetical protein [Clostridia bacterium]